MHQEVWDFNCSIYELTLYSLKLFDGDKDKTKDYLVNTYMIPLDWVELAINNLTDKPNRKTKI